MAMNKIKLEMIIELPFCRHEEIITFYYLVTHIGQEVGLPLPRSINDVLSTLSDAWRTQGLSDDFRIFDGDKSLLEAKAILEGILADIQKALDKEGAGEPAPA